LVVYKRQLAKIFAGLQYAEDNLTAILAKQHHYYPATSHHVQGVAQILLKNNYATLRECFLAGNLGKSIQLIGGKAAE
jgi:hypothetical protein